MMRKIRELDLETADWRFNIEVFEKPEGQGFVLEYWGTKPKYFASPPPGEATPTLRSSSPKPIALEGDQLDELIHRCKQEITDGYGQIIND